MKTTTFGIHRKWIVGVVGVLGAVASSLSLAFPFVIKLLPGTTHIASTIRENNAFASHPALTATSPAAYSGFAAATGLKGLAATVKLGNETMPINVAERRGLIRFTDSSIENLDPRSVP